MKIFVIILLWQHILYLCTLFLVQGGECSSGIFKYLSSMLTNDGRCNCDCRIAMTKAEFNKTKAHFTSTLDLKLRKKLVKCYFLEHSSIWC